MEVGGAFGVAFYILAQSAQSIQPLEFIDWLVNKLLGVINSILFCFSVLQQLHSQHGNRRGCGQHSLLPIEFPWQ